MSPSDIKDLIEVGTPMALDIVALIIVITFGKSFINKSPNSKEYVQYSEAERNKLLRADFEKQKSCGYRVIYYFTPMVFIFSMCVVVLLAKYNQPVANKDFELTPTKEVNATAIEASKDVNN